MSTLRSTIYFQSDIFFECEDESTLEKIFYKAECLAEKYKGCKVELNTGGPAHDPYITVISTGQVNIAWPQIIFIVGDIERYIRRFKKAKLS